VFDKIRDTTQPSHSWKGKVPRDYTDMTKLVLECTNFSFMIPVTLSAVLFAIPLGWNISVPGASALVLPPYKTSVTCYHSVQNVLFTLLETQLKI